MRKIFLIVILASLAACQKKGLPVITTRTQEPPVPVADTSFIAANLETGKALLAVRCARCHDQPDPAKYDSNRWERILGRMIPRARLNRIEANDVKAYVMANCAK